MKDGISPAEFDLPEWEYLLSSNLAAHTRNATQPPDQIFHNFKEFATHFSENVDFRSTKIGILHSLYLVCIGEFEEESPESVVSQKPEAESSSKSRFP